MVPKIFVPQVNLDECIVIKDYLTYPKQTIYNKIHWKGGNPLNTISLEINIFQSKPWMSQWEYREEKTISTMRKSYSCNGETMI